MSTPAQPNPINTPPDIPDGQPIGLLFVCLGNICRSPLAEGVFQHLARERGLLHRFDIDSAGTGAWHTGERADPRTIAIGQRYGVAVNSIARQIAPADWTRFHYILVMDPSNHANALRAGAPAQRLHYLRSFDPAHRAERNPQRLIVPDPYEDDDGFDLVYQQVHAAGRGLLEALITAHRLA
ncbi:MAG: low molecular weight protein-tyrosine-phosphatase [Phycisphaerales bacterium]